MHAMTTSGTRRCILALGLVMLASLAPPHALAQAPALLSSDPAAGASQVARSAWLRLEFAQVVPAETLSSFALSCDGTEKPIAVHVLEPALLIVNPEGELPAGASCLLSWPGPGGTASVAFTTAVAGRPAEVLYDRTDPGQTSPFPDDYWLVPDASTPTGLRVAIAVPDREPDVQWVFDALTRGTNSLDGFSPIGGIVVELSDAPDPDSLPLTPEASIEPLAPIGLFDLTPGSSTLGERVPFQLSVRSEAVIGQPLTHALVVFPSIPLTPGGRYGFVVTRRVRADPGRPFDPSPFFQKALQPAVPGEAPAIARVRDLAGEVLEVLASEAAPPIPPEDVALALRISVRTTADIPHDLVAMKEQVLAEPPPGFEITSVQPWFGDVEAVVTGSWETPNWREDAFLARDANGEPRITGTQTISFTLALPSAALDGPVPVTMYQHGNPGRAEWGVPRVAEEDLADAGFAVIGFTDTLNREVGQDEETQVLTIFLSLLFTRQLPDFWVQTTGSQMAFLRLIEQLGALDVLPLEGGDGVPDLDVSAPLTYLGISEGANKGQAFLPYAPEIRAGALVAGATRLAEILLHQDLVLSPSFVELFPEYIPNIRPPDIWVAFSLFQMIFDRQDPHNQAAFLYGNPVEVRGTKRKPSILVIEGINDRHVANNATRSLAWTMGPIPHLEPVQQRVPFLEPVCGPVRANIDGDTTSAFFQYVPDGLPDLPPTLGCRFEFEGHFCAQIAPESLFQRRVFFQTALTDPAPTIIDPLADSKDCETPTTTTSTTTTPTSTTTSVTTTVVTTTTTALRKLTICHKGKSAPADTLQTISVAAAAVPAHLAHGDTLGECAE